MRKFQLHDGKQGAALTVRVTPRARRTEVGGILDDGTLRVRVAEPPVEGKANKALLAFLARVLGVKKGRLQIIAGARGLDKIVTVMDLTAAEVEQRLDAWIQDHAT
jgi:uncharacterized protein (TIGR00251 family)